jgi:Phasin protein
MISIKGERIMAAPKRAAHSDTIRRTPDNMLIGGDDLTVAMQDWLLMTGKWQREMFDFAFKRLAKNGDTMRELQGVKTPADAWTIQARWMQETLQDYAAESMKLYSVAAKGARDAAQYKGPR